MSMRRVAGVHMRASRHRIAALTNQEGRLLVPSLKSDHKRELQRRTIRSSTPAPTTKNTTDNATPATTAPTPRYKKRRSVHKDESPRSGLRPSHTLQGSRSHSDYGMVSHDQRLEEQRKLSDYGLLPPVVLPCVPLVGVQTTSSSSTTSPKSRSSRSSWKIENSPNRELPFPCLSGSTRFFLPEEKIAVHDFRQA
ncbi:hypothetical protein Q1695_001493 [Nippostrongylus brasiliensis]|nr:hypothetical protein Q1695_001493 [Nippostrongylus brasiliensis]